MKPNKIILIIMFALANITTQGQVKPAPVKELKIGDTIPPLVLEKLISRPGEKLKITDCYKKGLLIIDFWATWCVPCVRELGTLDSISNEYHDKVSIIAAGYEEKSEIEYFLSRHKEIHPGSVNMLYTDEVLLSYFPHKFLPHNVWINDKGVVIAITDETSISRKNINNFLKNRTFNFEEKADDMTFDYKKPYHLADSLYTYRSIIAPFNPHINGGLIWNLGAKGNKKHTMSRVMAWNGCLLDMIWLTKFTNFGIQQDPIYDRVEFHVKDSLRFIPAWLLKTTAEKKKYPSYSEWNKLYSFTYELRLPSAVADTMMEKYIESDLKRLFHYTATIEKRNRNCWIMTYNNKVKLKPSTSKEEFDITGHSFISKGFTLDEMINQFTDIFSKRLGPTPIINETNITYPIDIDMNFGHTNGMKAEMIMERLAEYGFEFRQEVRPVNVLVISDN